MKLAPLLVAVPFVLVPGCLADAGDGPEDVGTAEEPGVNGRGGGPMTQQPDPITAARTWRATHSGPCADACWAVSIRRCEPCSEEDDGIDCEEMHLNCFEAAHARFDGLVGVSMCWRECDGLRN
jgi:hypothetical protein